MDLPNQQPWPSDAPAESQFTDEALRVQALDALGLRALQDDPELDRIAKFAANLCDAPTALINTIYETEQHFLAKVGEPNREVPPSDSICALAMVNEGLLEIPDTLKDPRVQELRVVKNSPYARYYAGLPLISETGVPLGALCIIDTEPRPGGLTELQREGLEVLALAIKRRFASYRESKLAVAEIKASAARLQLMLDSVPDIAWSAAPGPIFDRFNARFSKVTGKPPPQNVEEWRPFFHPDDYVEARAKLQNAMSNATVHEAEWRLRQADGGYRWVISRAMPSSDDPKTARWFGTITDIHDHHVILEEREMLAGELAHRIKNIFSVIIGLVTLQARGDQTLRVFADSLAENIRALARAQDFALRIDQHETDDLKGLLEVLMSPYGRSGQQAVSIQGAAVPIGSGAATPLALVFHEMATNSAKYGSLSDANGEVKSEVEVTSDKVVIVWREVGGPKPQKPDTFGFGKRMMTMAIENQLGGTINLDWGGEGLVATFHIPAARLKT